jgi:chorismate lyase/3-hydroxybenzoate synthase
MIEDKAFSPVSIGAFSCLQSPDYLAGVCCLAAESPFEDLTYRTYTTLLQSLQGYRLLRVWNYVPHINRESHGMEHYQQFCMGRARAFEEPSVALPAASAVGIEENRLSIAFLACRFPVHHFENPEQLPAYQYPRCYGPKSPSFSRAARADGTSASLAYISGTASIKGHASLHPDDFEKQLETTLDNLSLMADKVTDGRSQGPLLSESTLYLRNPSHLEMLLSHLQKRGLCEGEHRVILADICRKELLLEIETQVSAIRAG